MIEPCKYFTDRRQLFHDREKVINESGESRISGEGEGSEPPQTNGVMAYPQLLIAVAKNSFPEVAMAVQDVLKNQEPILNLQKRDLYLEAVRTRNVPIIREVMVSIRPCALFPKHYKFTVMMESISAGDPDVVDVICKMLLPRSKLTKEDTVRILEGALAIDNQRILVSICASLKTKRLVERDHAYRLLLKAVESKDLVTVLHILRAIRPRRKLTVQQKSYLLQTSVDSCKLEIVNMILRMCGKIPSDEITNCLIQAVKSTPDIFLHLIHKLKPKLSETSLDNLLNNAYIVEGNNSLTSHIIKHYPPPPNIAHKFLQLFIRDSTEVLIPSILAHVNKLTNEEVQHICGLSLKTCSNLFRFFTGTHDCPRETISEIIMDHLQDWKPGGSCVSSCQTRLSPGLSDTLVQVLKSLQFSESNILKNLYLNCAKSGNSHALGLLNNSEWVNREKCILDALENLMCHSSHSGPIEVLLHSHSTPTKEFIARLEVLTKNSRADKRLIAAVQKYTSTWKYRESEI